MRFLGLASLGLFIDIMRELGFVSSLSIYDIKKWFYENALHIGNTPCYLEWNLDGIKIVFHDKYKTLLEVTLTYGKR